MPDVETITGSLEDALAKMDCGTIQHAREIMNDWRTQAGCSRRTRNGASS